MSPRVKEWIGRLGLIGHLARMVVFGLIGIFLIKAAVDYNPSRDRPRRCLGENRASVVRAVPARGRRRRADRVRALLAQRRAVPQEFERENRLNRPDRQASIESVSGGHGMRCSLRNVGSAASSASRSAPIIAAVCAGSAGKHALDPPRGGWAAGDPPPRSGNTVEVLIDGEQALPVIAEEVQRRAVACPSDRLVLLTGLRARTRRRAGRASEPSRRSCRTRRRACARLGRSAASALSPFARRRSEDA